ncbi:ClpP/crotonase-like domain-containing protein [Amylostereum chailletii]|nr:ClpP/crotonase-like domain-containing protein [Amylostereum chailletii]
MFLATFRRGAQSRPLRLAFSARFLSSSAPEASLQPFSKYPGVSALYLNRPQSKNAISLRLLDELTSCLDEARFDDRQVSFSVVPLRVLIVCSSTLGSFCAGADLAERRTMSGTQVDKFLVDLRAALGKLESLPVPTIAAIDGPALGGGLELALACDLRVAGHSVTKIGLPETKLGIIPGAGGTQRATRLLGLSKAKDLIFTGRMLAASEAADWGLLDYVSDEGTSAVDRALALAEQISANAPLALRSAKLAISRAVELPLEPGLDFERAAYEPLLKSKDRVEALQAFKEKRRPVFKGE